MESSRISPKDSTIFLLFDPQKMEKEMDQKMAFKWKIRGNKGNFRDLFFIIGGISRKQKFGLGEAKREFLVGFSGGRAGGSQGGKLALKGETLGGEVALVQLHLGYQVSSLNS